MQVIGYIRVSTEEQDLTRQEHLLLKYAQQHAMQINDFIQVEISSRKSTKERRIDELLARLDSGDEYLAFGQKVPGAFDLCINGEFAAVRGASCWKDTRCRSK